MNIMLISLQRRILLWIIMLFFILSCQKPSEETLKELAKVSTIEPYEITDSTAHSGGKITNNGGVSITEQGVVWSTTPNPTIEHDSVAIGATGVSEYFCTLFRLSADRTYYVRAYAKNEVGTAYGNTFSFKTNPKPVIVKCQIEKQFVSHHPENPEFAYGESMFTKIFNPDGSVYALMAVMYGRFGKKDSLYYTFKYRGNKIDIDLSSYRIENFLSPSELFFDSFSATFDEATGHIADIDGSEFIYNNRKLVQFSNHTFEYDQNGNLVYVKLRGRDEPETTEGIQYKYDLNQKAGVNDIFDLTGLHIDQHYCLAEIMGWLPVVAKNRRTNFIINWGVINGQDYIAADLPYSNHIYDSNGYLISYDVLDAVVRNTWRCAQ